jgi:Response regulator containing CheY-like receiver domain and AraC-type DNA-binding domain
MNSNINKSTYHQEKSSIYDFSTSILDRVTYYRNTVLSSLIPLSAEPMLDAFQKSIAIEQPNALKYASPEDREMKDLFATMLAVFSKNGTEIMVGRNFSYPASFHVPRQGVYHKHQFIEMFYVIDGTFDQILLGEHYHFTKGEIVITDQNCEHSDYISGNNSAVLFIQIQPEFMDRLLKSYTRADSLQQFLFHSLARQKDEQSFLELKPENPEVTEQMNFLTERLVSEEYALEPGNQEIITGYLIRLLQLLCTNFQLQIHRTSKAGKEKEILYEVERYIRLNLSTVTAKDLEAHFFYHRNYYNLLLKKHRNESLQTYILKQRLSWARNLLETTDYSVKIISSIVGYENTSFFYHKYKKYYGTSPSEQRKRADSYSHNL